MNTRHSFARPFAAFVALLTWALAGLAYAAPHEFHGPEGYAEAAKQIKGHVFIATGSGGPPALVEMAREHALGREGQTHAYYMVPFASQANFEPHVTTKWHPHILFGSKQTRAAANEGRATLHHGSEGNHASLFELAQQFRRDEQLPIDQQKLPIDTVLVRVSPPDEHGNVSLGSTSDLTRLAIDAARRNGGHIIAEVNENVPHMAGNQIPYAWLTHVVKRNELLGEADRLVPEELETQIAAHVAGLIPAHVRPTIQVGYGNALAAVPDALKGRPLDIWSEMGGHGLVRLVTDPGSQVGKAKFSFMHAGNEEYQAASHHPRITMGTSEELNDPDVIAKIPHMFAINTALEVDLFGNVNAQRDGDKLISFPGGQPDFMKGAATNPQGTAILALRSRALGALSTVVTKLKGPITTPQDHVDHVVTEWGATKRLRGQSNEFRAYQMISVAYPAFRGELADAAKERGLLTAPQVAELKNGVPAAVRTAPHAIREELADEALKKGLISADDHAEIVVDLLLNQVQGGQ